MSFLIPFFISLLCYFNLQIGSSRSSFIEIFYYFTCSITMVVSGILLFFLSIIAPMLATLLVTIFSGFIRLMVFTFFIYAYRESKIASIILDSIIVFLSLFFGFVFFISHAV
jgi:hypothetical protein